MPPSIWTEGFQHYSHFWPSPKDHMQAWDCSFGGDFDAGRVIPHQPSRKVDRCQRHSISFSAPFAEADPAVLYFKMVNDG
jgi:hypothetical protein